MKAHWHVRYNSRAQFMREWHRARAGSWGRMLLQVGAL